MISTRVSNVATSKKIFSNGHFIPIFLKATIEEVQLYFKLTDFVIYLTAVGKEMSLTLLLFCW